MGERGFETSNLGGDLWSMGFDVDLALDAHSSRKLNVCPNPVGVTASSLIVGGNVNIGYGDMQHMLLHRFEDDLNEGDISQITDLTNSLPKGDSESAQSFLAKIACQDLTRELGAGSQGSTSKSIEASLFGSVNDGGGHSNVVTHKAPLQPVDVYGRVSLYEGKLVLQLRHFNVNTNYPINVGECWLCREKMSNGSLIHSHKHALQGLFQVNDEFVQMDIDHYIIPEQALEPDPPEVNRNLNTHTIIDSSNPSSLVHVVNGARSLVLGDEIVCPQGLQGQHVNLNAIGNSLHATQQNLVTSNETLQTPKSNGELQFSETDLSSALNTTQQSLNSTVSINSNTFLSTFTSPELRMGSVPPSIVQTQNESVMINHVTGTISPTTASTFSQSTLNLSTCNNNPVTNSDNLISSNGITDSHSTLSDMNSIQALCTSSNSVARNDGFIQHTSYEPNIGAKEQLESYHNFFGHPYSYSYEGTELNTQLPKISVDAQLSSSSNQLYDSSLNQDSPNKSVVVVVNKRTEVGAKKRKSRAQKKPSRIRMRDEREQSVEPLLLQEKKSDISKDDLGSFANHEFGNESITEVSTSKPVEEHNNILNSSNTVATRSLSEIVSMIAPPPYNSISPTTKEFELCCPSCNLEFTNKNVTDFKTHLKVHKFDSSYLFGCSCCSKKICGSDKYIQHIKMHTEKRHYCLKCDANYSRPDKLRRHIVNVHDSKKPFVCDICSKAFNRMEYLKAHKNIHLGKKFECDICHRFCSSLFNLKVHKKRHTNETLPYACELCERAFLRKDVLELHVSKDHKNKRFKCDICSKLFSRNDVLRRHKETHDDKRVPYNCDVCNKKFYRKDSLKAHSYEHQDPKKDTPKKIKKPTKRTKSKDILKQLKIEKRKEQCNICLKYFPSTSRLEKHLRWHQAQIELKVDFEKDRLKIHECETCAKSFRTKDLMKRHMLRVHCKADSLLKETKMERERNFVCDVCSKRFTRSSNLKTHLKTHMKKNLEDDEMLAELPTVLNASKTKALKGRKKSYLSLTKDSSGSVRYSAIELITSASCSNSALDGMSKEHSSNVSSFHLPLEGNNFNGHFPSHLSGELPIPASSFCSSSPNSPINLSTEAISAAAYLLSHPFYEGSYQ